jgi:hypothetical protein
MTIYMDTLTDNLPVGDITEKDSSDALNRFTELKTQLDSYEKRKAEFQMLPEWQSDVSYQPGFVVRHNNRKFIKADDNDQSPPDDIAGGWTPI